MRLQVSPLMSFLVILSIPKYLRYVEEKYEDKNLRICSVDAIPGRMYHLVICET